MRQKRGNGGSRGQESSRISRQESSQQPGQASGQASRQPPDQLSSGRHRTLIAAHLREASDPRHTVAPHPRAAGDAHAYDRDAYHRDDYDAADAYPPDVYPTLAGASPEWYEPVVEEWAGEEWAGEEWAGEEWDEPLDGPGDDEWDRDATARMDQSRRRTNGSVIFDRETGLLPINLPALGAPHSAPTASSLPTALAPVPLARSPHHNTLQRVTRGVTHGVQRAAATGALVLRIRARNAGATVIPGKDKVAVHIPALPGKRTRASRIARPAVIATVCVALLGAVLLAGAANPGGIITPFTQGIWASRGSVHTIPAPIGGWWAPPIISDAPAAPSTTDPAHYVGKYGFDWPSLSGGISSAERQRLEYMLPFAQAATARWDARYGDTLEPEMLLFWTHAEGIAARVNYSNCANEGAPPGTSWFTHITNCDTPSFWQLGYGNQFSVIAILKTAFTDMRGDPNDPSAVQKVGQAVLDWDRKQGASPTCGGYSCTFPAMTIDQIMSGVSLNHETTDDWWASVLSRDPAINCYMLARALVWFNHNATRNWIGCYYAEPCWGYESNSLGDILAAWDSLRKAAGV